MTDQVEVREGGGSSGGVSRRHALGLGGAAVGGIALAATLTDAAEAADGAEISLELANHVIRAGVRYVQQHPARHRCTSWWSTTAGRRSPQPEWTATAGRR